MWRKICEILPQVTLSGYIGRSDFKNKTKQNERFPLGRRNLGSKLHPIVSKAFIFLHFNRGIICFKWHHIVDSREAYCPPFMSLIKDTESYCSRHQDWEVSTITLPHLHKGLHSSIYLSGLRAAAPAGRKKQSSAEICIALLRFSMAPRQADVLSSDSQQIRFVVHFHLGSKGLFSLSATHWDERIRAGKCRQCSFPSITLKSQQ